MTRQISAGRFLSLTVLLSLATMAAAQTQSTTAIEKGAPTVNTVELKGQVEGVQGPQCRRGQSPSQGNDFAAHGFLEHPRQGGVSQVRHLDRSARGGVSAQGT